jgi:hypothetical protein
MARLSLDNFPEPKTEWATWQKVLLIAATAGLGYIIWYFITKAYKTKKLAQAETAVTQEKLKIAEQEKATREKATTALTGQAMANAISQITIVAMNESKNQPPTDGSVPSV